MLEMKRATVPLDEEELMELEAIITDADEEEALRFLHKKVYDKVSLAQRHCEVFRAGNKEDGTNS